MIKPRRPDQPAAAQPVAGKDRPLPGPVKGGDAFWKPTHWV